MKNLKTPIDPQNSIKTLYNDKILKILLNNSHLTEIQLETLLINLLSASLDIKEKNPKNIGQYRIKRQVSRGSFNRSLKQAQKNILKSIYTLLLIGYLNIADSSSVFLQFLEISNKLKEYVEMRKDSTNLDEKSLEYFKTIQVELEQILTEYASTKLQNM